MSRLTRDGTAEPVSRDQILRHASEQGNINFPCSADHEQDWQPSPVDPYSAICDDHTYIYTYILELIHLVRIHRSILRDRYGLSVTAPLKYLDEVVWLYCSPPKY